MDSRGLSQAGKRVGRDAGAEGRVEDGGGSVVQHRCVPNHRTELPDAQVADAERGSLNVGAGAAIDGQPAAVDGLVVLRGAGATTDAERTREGGAV